MRAKLLTGLTLGAGLSIGVVLGMIAALEVVAWLDKKGLKWPPK